MKNREEILKKIGELNTQIEVLTIERKEVGNYITASKLSYKIINLSNQALILYWAINN